MQTRRGAGRRTIEPRSGEKATLGIRASADLKRELDRAAKENARSLSQEAEIRLERSFNHGHLLAEVADLNYRDIELTALMLTLGETIQSAIRAAEQTKGKAHWLSDPFVFDAAVRAAIEVLDAARPPGQEGDSQAGAAEFSTGAPIRLPKPGSSEDIGKGCARFVFFRILGSWSRPYPWLNAVRERSGVLLERFKARWKDASLRHPARVYFPAYDQPDLDLAMEAFSALTEGDELAVGTGDEI